MSQWQQRLVFKWIICPLFSQIFHWCCLLIVFFPIRWNFIFFLFLVIIIVGLSWSWDAGVQQREAERLLLWMRATNIEKPSQMPLMSYAISIVESCEHFPWWKCEFNKAFKVFKCCKLDSLYDLRSNTLQSEEKFIECLTKYWTIAESIGINYFLYLSAYDLV